MKVSIVVDKELPLGLAANCAAVLGVSLGALRPDIVGPDLEDKSGVPHRGITGVPLPVLAADRAALRALVREAVKDESIEAIPFNDVAQKCVSYDDYRNRLGAADFESLDFLGVLLIGAPKAVNRLTGSLPLLR